MVALLMVASLPPTTNSQSRADSANQTAAKIIMNANTHFSK
jgi:hypothetical protein